MLGLAALISCGSPSPPPPELRAAAAIPAEPPPPAALGDADWGAFGSRRFSLAVAVPERAAWQRSETRNWFVLRHEPSQSELRLRIWRAARLVKPADCEAEARTLAPSLPVLDETNLVERTRAGVPQGFDTDVGVGVEPDGPRRIRGYVLAFGAAIGRCFASVFTTTAESEIEVGDRLELVADRVLSRVRVADVEDRVPEP